MNHPFRHSSCSVQQIQKRCVNSLPQPCRSRGRTLLSRDPTGKSPGGQVRWAWTRVTSTERIFVQLTTKYTTENTSRKLNKLNMTQKQFNWRAHEQTQHNKRVTLSQKKPDYQKLPNLQAGPSAIWFILNEKCKNCTNQRKAETPLTKTDVRVGSASRQVYRKTLI